MENNSALMTKIAQAKIHDKVRWPHYSDQQPDASTLYLDEIRQKVAWLNEQWSTTIGDVNQDKSVNSADITAIYNYILNGDDAFLKSSDVNGDGAINAADVTAVYNIILGN